MITTKLITLTDIQAFKGITANVNKVKDLDPHILDAQEFNLRPFMGESFYLDLIDDFESSPSLVKYSDLWNGKRYTYQGEKYEFGGLKAVLVYHTFARYLGRNGAKDTPHGTIQKVHSYGNHVSEKTITRLMTEAKSQATSHEKKVIEFLGRYSSEYPEYKCPGDHKYKGGMNIKAIG